MFGLDTKQLIVVAVALAMVGWILWDNRGLLSAPFAWLTSAAAPDASKAFAEIQSLRAYAKAVKCDVMDSHLAEAGKCLFDHSHAPHPPAPETVA